MDGKLVIFSAPSGSGKTTIVNNLLELDLGLEFSISATSRPPRGEEMDGKAYYFISPGEFRKKIEDNQFLEWEEVYENQFYGTLRSEIDRIWNNNHHVLFDIDVKGGVNIKKEFGDRALSVFVKPPSLNVLIERLKNRGTDNQDSLKKRIEKAEYEMTYASLFDKILVNDKLERAIAEAIHIVRKFLES